MPIEKANAAAAATAALVRGGGVHEAAEATGVYTVECIRNGEVVWREEVCNTVMTEGKNVALDAYLAGAAYTVTGPFMGLISSVGFSAIAAADTAAQLAGTNGWREAGGGNAPTYTGNRKTAAWNAAAAGAKALSAALSFAISGGGTVKGAFLIYGTGALNTKDDTNGKLYSAGLFSGGDRAVLNGDTINVSYTASL